VLGVKGAFFASEHAVVVTPLPQTDICWLTYVLREMRLNQYSESSAQPGLSVSKLLDLQLAFPPQKTEQQSIATALSDTDTLISSLEKLIAKKRNLKQGAMQELLTGKRRLPGFGGAVEPGVLGEIFLPKPRRKQIANDELVVFLGMEDVAAGGGLLNQTVLVSKNVRSGLTPFERGDVLVAKITPCFENGKGAFLSDLKCEVGFGSTEFHVLRAMPGADAQYIYYHTMSAEFRRQLESEMIGTAGQKRVPIGAIANYPIPMKHSYAEQKAITKVLAEMDDEITALETQLHKFTFLKQAMMQVLLTGKIRLI
jgi:type I restriction enzyme S subunit